MRNLKKVNKKRGVRLRAEFVNEEPDSVKSL